MSGRKLVLNAEGSELRLGVVHGGELVEYFLERKRERGITGNIYRGRVNRVLPGMQAAFLDLGPGVERKAYLYVAEILGAGDERRLLDGYDEDPGSSAKTGSKTGSKKSGSKAGGRSRRAIRKSAAERKIEDLLKEKEDVLVQIVKEPVGEKGARVTGYLSLPGRHCVFMPTIGRVGVSRRISSEKERRRLRQIVDDCRPEGAGFIVRTAAEGADEQEIRDDVDYLLRLWEEIQRREKSSKGPRLLYADLDLVLRTIRDLLRDDVEEMVIDDEEQYQRARKFTDAFMPRYTERVRLYDGRQPIFDAYGVEQQLRASLGRRVPLKSGGSLIIEQGEALTAIDVNTGSFVGKDDLESTITANNLEACQAVARQLRLRNIGGIIVIDFVDMDKAENRKLVWEEFNRVLASDTTRANVTKISELGLVEMTRKRTRESLHQMLTERCPTCEGRGVVKSTVTVGYEILREIRRVGSSVKADRIMVECVPKVADWLQQNERDYLDHLEKRFQKKVEIKVNRGLSPDHYKVEGRVVKIEEAGKKERTRNSKGGKPGGSQRRGKKKTASDATGGSAG